MLLLVPILSSMAADALIVAGLVLAARVALFAHNFVRKGL